MPVFYLHLHDGADKILDPEGLERPSVDAAIAAALAGARDVMSQSLRDGVLDVAGRIEIEDDRGRLVHTLRFTDAVAITGF